MQRDPRPAVATVFSNMRNVSVAIGIGLPGQPNFAIASIPPGAPH